jgi:hypothetical protein
MQNVAAASELLEPFDARLMHCYPVSTGINRGHRLRQRFKRQFGSGADRRWVSRLAKLKHALRRWYEPPVCRSLDSPHQPLGHFALHHVFIPQPQDSLGHLGIR